jgi:hypothetical protein
MLGEDGEAGVIALYGVDPVTGKLKAWWFFGDGGVADCMFTPTEDGWIQDFKGTRPSGGGSGELRAKITVVDEDTHKTQRLSMVIEGKEQEVSGEVTTWTRRRAEE